MWRGEGLLGRKSSVIFRRSWQGHKTRQDCWQSGCWWLSAHQRSRGVLTELILVASKEDFVMGKISFLPSTSLVTAGPRLALTGTSMRTSKLLIAMKSIIVNFKTRPKVNVRTCDYTSGDAVRVPGPTWWRHRHSCHFTCIAAWG